MKQTNHNVHPIVPLRDIESIVTIANGNHTIRTSSRFSLLKTSMHPSVSIVTLHGASLVVTCLPPSYQSANPSGNRISIAIYTPNGIRGNVRMKHTPTLKSGYKATCLVPKRDYVVLLAIDTIGKMHCSNIVPDGGNSRRIDINACDTNNHQESLMFMNTLTACMERVSLKNSQPTSMQNTQESVKRDLSATPKSSRKRNHSLKKTTSEGSLNTHGIYVVASCLNAPMPSYATPIIMYLTADVSTLQWKCVSSASLLIDPSYGPMTCIAFVSKTMCADIWELILSDAKESKESDLVDEGVILIGFRDGSLRASAVYRKGSVEGDITISTSLFETLIHNDEGAFVSLELIPSGETTSSMLVGCKTNGDIVVFSSTRIHRLSVQCESRVISMHVITYKVSSPDLTLAFVGVYDTGRSFFHHVTITIDDSCIRGWKVEKRLLPIPLSILSVVVPYVCHSNDRRDCMFAMSQCSGSVILFRMHFEEVCNSTEIDTESPIQTRLLRKSDVSMTRKRHNTKSAHELPTVKSLLQRLKSVVVHREKQCAHSSASSSHSPEAAIKEIREAIRFSSYIRGSSMGLSGHLPPWRRDGCLVIINSAPFMKECFKIWDFAVHAIQVRSPSSSRNPCSYRLAGERNPVQTKVSYEGVAQSFGKRDLKHETANDKVIHLPSLQPKASIFGSLQTRYSDSERVWHMAKPIVDTSLDYDVAVAAKCSSLVHFIPISETQIRNTFN